MKRQHFGCITASFTTNEGGQMGQTENTLRLNHFDPHNPKSSCLKDSVSERGVFWRTVLQPCEQEPFNISKAIYL